MKSLYIDPLQGEAAVIESRQAAQMIKILQDKGAKCSFRYTIEFNGQTKQGQSLVRFKLIKSANSEWKIEKFISRE